MAKRRRRHLKLFPLIIILLILGGGLYGAYYLYDYEHDKKIAAENRRKEEEKRQKQEAYNKCITAKYYSAYKPSSVEEKEQAILAYIRQNNLSVSIYYQDVNTGYTFTYNEDKVYYGCSLIKLVDTLYILDKINSGEMTFDTKVPYNKNYYIKDNPCMEKYPPGEDIEISKVIECALTVSDNIAHRIMINYIGFNALQSYGRSLGAKNILTGGDSYGMQSAKDMNIYLNKLYQDLVEYPTSGNIIKGWMNNTYWNHLAFDNTTMIHKYGYYGDYYHDVGIFFTEHPYFISILTLHGNGSYINTTNTLSKKINELHTLYDKEVATSCHNKVYGH